eukprot:TRINITY_DN4813_c0_g1_i3.p1 TRINITY_DN4813_c0_g1~~TRINITY_DN4813_c0_g1_i3.p1  ORF type:complete len:260 (-),score=27.57 TRINITY_DN4813_c0_g1_i3:49-828(-)
MVLELNASDDRGIDVVRQQIKDFASAQTIFNSGVKLVILDEADSMTNPAQAALRRVIEKYTRNTRFCMIGNYVNKIIPALQSRCTRFRFAPLKNDMIRPRLDHIIKQEKITIDEGAIEALLQISGGDMRKILNILQSTVMSSSHGAVSSDSIYQCTGNPNPEDVRTMLEVMLTREYQEAFQEVQTMKSIKGLALADILGVLNVIVQKIDLSPETRIFLLDHMAQMEYRLALGGTEKAQLGALVGVFQLVRESLSPNDPL